MKRVFLKSMAASALLVSGLAQAQQPVEIVVDYPYAGIFKEVHEKIARDFTAKFPQYKVTFRAPTPGYEEAAQQSLRQAVTNQLPDVSYQGLNRQRVFVDRGIAVDMAPFIKSEKDWAKMGYDKALLSLGQVGDKQVGIGFSLSTPIVYFNADLVRKAGVSPEQFPAPGTHCRTGEEDQGRQCRHPQHAPGLGNHRQLDVAGAGVCQRRRHADA